MMEEAKSIQEIQKVDVPTILQSSFLFLMFAWVLDILFAYRDLGLLEHTSELAAQGQQIPPHTDWVLQIFFPVIWIFLLIGYWLFANGIAETPIGARSILPKMLKLLVLTCACLVILITANSLYLHLVMSRAIWILFLSLHLLETILSCFGLLATLIFLKCLIRFAKAANTSLLEILCWLDLFISISGFLIFSAGNISYILIEVDFHLLRFISIEFLIFLHNIRLFSEPCYQRIEMVNGIINLVAILLAASIKQLLFRIDSEYPSLTPSSRA
ncbi:MAG TPA: hypothetical protein VMG59_13905 [Phycisphaerae bacterium]|nr:hypothetical protein [Phycisphaerae bacterium]